MYVLHKITSLLKSLKYHIKDGSRISKSEKDALRELLSHLKRYEGELEVRITVLPKDMDEERVVKYFQGARWSWD